jgi:prepilin-type N-terminal cleavage/methylation domain-containing protein
VGIDFLIANRLGEYYHMLINLKLNKGFSLAELTITLAILGTLAVSLLPMISNSQAGPRKYTAMLKTTLTTIENAVATEVLRGNNGTNNFTLIQRALKPEKSCPNNASAEGCWNAGIQNGTSVAVNGEAGQPGFILKNGVALVGLDATNQNGWAIDTNGTEGPNQLNVDQLLVMICLDEVNTCTNFQSGGAFNPTGEYKPSTGSFLPFPETWPGATGSPARFNEIME